MTLEEFKNKVFNLRQETMQKIDEIRKSFSDSFPLKNGDLIQNKKSGEIYAFSRLSFDTLFSSWPHVYFYKMKKDGTPSKIEIFICSLSDIQSFLDKYEILISDSNEGIDL